MIGSRENDGGKCMEEIVFIKSRMMKKISDESIWHLR